MINTYYDYLTSLIRTKDSHRYNKLLRALFDKKFYWKLNRDSNRAEDGLDMRLYFEDKGVGTVDELDQELGNDCRVLEMMVALAKRCEDQIMTDPEIGDRTPDWFWIMIVNLGLFEMTDGNFDEDYVQDTLDRFLDRRYSRNGRGGLFELPESHKLDMRRTEIWYQLMAFLNENFEGGI